MNKITIPALLLGVVMIAGAFAFMPVQEASTVHTTVIADTAEPTNVSSLAANFDLDEGSTLTITSNEDYVLVSLTCEFDDGDAAGPGDINSITADGQPVSELTIGNMIADNVILDGGISFPGLNIGGEAGTDIVITFGIDEADINEVMDCEALLITEEGATVSATFA